MKAFRAVADSSCLIGLAQIELFVVLKDLFLEVYIPQAVYEEVVVKGRGEPGSNETESAVRDGWISIKAVREVGFRISDKLYRCFPIQNRLCGPLR